MNINVHVPIGYWLIPLTLTALVLVLGHKLTRRKRANLSKCDNAITAGMMLAADAYATGAKLVIIRLIQAVVILAIWLGYFLICR